jgi:uncharacterized protein YfaS (alpha-2-macroglobulin family)
MTRPRLLVVVAAAIVALAALGGGLAYLLTRPPSECPEGMCVESIGPSGDEVDRTTPVTITFTGGVDKGKAERALKISPEAEGSFTWKKNTLSFVPEWPGFARGVSYQVELATPEAHLPQGEPVSFSFKTAGQLRVESVIPDPDATEVGIMADLMVQFNRSVAPLTVLEEAPPGQILQFAPPVQGEGRWVNSSLYSFRPEEGWRPATHYLVTVPTALTDVLGGTLLEDYVWSFDTVMPAVEDVFPRDNADFVGPRSEVKVIFNQPMDRAAAESAFSLVSESSGARPAGSISWSDDFTMVFSPSAPYEPEARYAATMDGGIPNALGTASTESEKRWHFTTVGPPRVISSDPASGETQADRYGVEIDFSNPMDVESVEDNISVEPESEDGPYYYWEPSNTILHIGLTMEPSAPYTVSLAGGSDRYGQSLTPFTLSFVTAPLEPSLSVMRSGQSGTYNAYLEPQVVVRTTNVSRADFALYRIDFDDFRAAVLISEYGAAGEYEPADDDLLRRWSETIAEPPLDSAATISSYLGGENGGRLEPGFYFLEVSAPGAAYSDATPIVVSKTNLTLKYTDTTALVWALDVDSGQPLADLSLEIINWQGERIGGGTTDGDGIFEGTITKAAPEDKYRPFYVVGDRAGDVVLTSSQWNNGITAWDFDLPAAYQVLDLAGHVYTDRPIYRPGEKVYYKGVLRTDDDAEYGLPPAGPGATLMISDSMGREILSSEIELSDYGTFDGELDLSAEAATGFYSITIQRGEDTIAWSGFSVAEFRKPEFEVDLTTDRDAYVNGDRIKADVSASYFFGAPTADAEVSWQVTSEDFIFHADDYPDYSFVDFDEYEYLFFGLPRSEGEGQTDGQGAFEFETPANVSSDQVSQAFRVEATVTDVNEQQVSASAEVIVHKAEFYIGLRPQRYVYDAGEPAAVEVVSVDREGKPQPDTSMTVSIYRRRWITARVREPNGEQYYQSEPEDTLIETREVTTDSDATATVTFTPEDGGTYRVVADARDARGNDVHSATSVWVSSGEYISWRVTNDDRIELVADKSEYSPGDTARILVTAPFDDSVGLVTEERGKILSHQIRDFNTNSTILEVPIREEHVPNVFVSVVLFKAPTADNPMPSFKVGYVELPVSIAEKELSITIEPSAEELEPRDEISYTITTRDSSGEGVAAEVTLALVDKALLSLADQQGQDALEAFWSRRSLAVNTSATYAVSIDRANEVSFTPEGGGKGGGGGVPGETRTFFPNTAYWNPDLRTDDNGRATVSVKLPDTLTTWRLTANAVTETTQVGQGTNEVVTSKDLIVRPVVPRFLIAGDTPTLKAVVHNFSDEEQEVEVSFSSETVSPSGERTQKVDIPAGELAEVSWETVVSRGETAALKFDADGGGLSDSVEISVPVYEFVSPEVTATGGEVVDESSEAVLIPYYVDPSRGELTVTVASSLAAGLGEGVQFLEEYPYESVEQTVSRLITRLALHRAVSEAGLPDTLGAGEDMEGLVARTSQRLYSQQHFDGGWGWWLNSPSDPFLTAFALFGLGQARHDGYAVDDYVLDRAAEYLGQELDRPFDVENPQNPDLRAFILLAMAESDRGDLGRTFALAEQRATLGPFGIASLIVAIRELSPQDVEDPRLKTLISDLTSAAVASATGNHWQEDAPDYGIMSTNTRATAAALNALVRVDPDHPLVEGTVRWLMVARRDGHWETTQDTAFSTLALADFVAAREELGDFDYRVELNGETVGEGQAKADEPAATDEVTVALEDMRIGEENRLRLVRTPPEAKGRLYYTMHLRYFTPAEEVEAASIGVGVGRDYLPAEGAGAPLESVPVGEMLKVRLTVYAPSDLHFLVVEDFLPAGLEAIDTSLETTSFEVRALLAEEQRRIYEEQRRQGLYFNPFSHVDIRDNRVVLFADFVPKGSHEYVYFARATTPGEFHLPPTNAFEMYFPEVWGRTDGRMFTVSP